MNSEHFFLDLAFVVAIAGGLSWLALMLRQPVILGYILCGILAGPFGFGLVHGIQFVDEVGRVGIALLLFLAGMTLHPVRLAQLFRQTMVVTAVSSICCALLAGGFAWLWQFEWRECVIIGLACMFSSTILVVKLMPTTALHHQHMGAICIAILIAQDLLAIALLMFLAGMASTSSQSFLLLPVKAVGLISVALVIEQFVLRWMLHKSDRFHETLLLLSLAWCLSLAMLAEWLGLSLEAGAFVAGVAMARNPIACFLSERLKPFRDFFLVLFFFVLGARLNLFIALGVLAPAILLALLLLAAKPYMFRLLLLRTGEPPAFAQQAGLRLGQSSEFALILATFAAQTGVLAERASQFVQLVTLITLIASSYIVVFRLPTPLGRKGLQQD